MSVFWRLLHKQATGVLAILVIVGALLVLWHTSRTSQNVVDATALQHAELYSDAIIEFRRLYTCEVVETVRTQGIEVTHDFDRGEKKGKAIPLPATFTRLLGKTIGEREGGAETRLYSAYPFPYEGRQGLGDDFAKEAWQTFQQDHEEPFYRFEQLDGRPVLRYARADLMRRSCVDCHNNHRDTPRNGWKEGDVRGVLEVILPMDMIESQMRASLRESTIFIIAMTTAGLVALGVVVGGLRRTRTELEDLSNSLERRVTERSAALKQTTDSLRRMSKVFQDGTDPILIEDLNGEVLELNEAAEQAYGWTHEELLGQSIKTIVPAARHEQADELLERCRSGELVRNEKGLRQTKSGDVIPVLVTLSLLTDEAGQPTGVAALAKDIGELNRTQEALEQHVAETQQLNADLNRSNATLRRFNKLAVGHELRMVELKREINELLEAAGEPLRYDLSKQDELVKKGESDGN